MSRRLVNWFLVGVLVGAGGVGLFLLGGLYERQVASSPQDISGEQATQAPIGSVAYAQDVTDVSEDLLTARRNAITAAIDRSANAVVGITVTQVREYSIRSPFSDDPFFRHFFGIPDRTYREKIENLGSGFLMSSDGYVVTNQHVVSNATEIMVTLPEGESYEAALIGADYDSDLALLKIEADHELPYLPLGDIEDVIVGEWAVAIGNPFGLFKMNDQPSVSVGVVSALGRNFERQEDGRLYRNMIQTDAAINPGNSGGPLINVNGELIGVNTFIFTGGGQGSVGVGFAIHVNTVREVVYHLLERGGEGRDVWTGLAVQNIDGLIALSLGYRGGGGVIVTQIEKGSPGDKAGIKPRDIILEINGTPITDTWSIRKYFDNHDFRVGDILRFTLFREGRKIARDLELESRDD